MTVQPDMYDQTLSEVSDSVPDDDETRESDADCGDDHRPAIAAGSGSAIRPQSRAVVATGIALTVVMTLALLTLCGWFGLRVTQSQHEQQQASQFVQAARQAVLNLTTISHAEADRDVARILDSITGAFRDDFAQRSSQFVEVVEQARSDTVGTITAAGLDSVDGDKARVLVAVSVRTSQPGVPEQQPSLWRMRLDVTRVGADVKVSNVEFVS